MNRPILKKTFVIPREKAFKIEINQIFRPGFAESAINLVEGTSAETQTMSYLSIAYKVLTIYFII